MTNRRSEKRVKVTGKIDAVITYSDTLSHASCGTVSDLSINGMFLKTTSSMSRDAYVNMKIETGNILGKPLWIQGLVVRSGKDGVGIRFTYTEQGLAQLLSH